ncbi:uncharacterized protein LOC122894404 [Neovison vison]|uniref:uncharacterized protein LOC122894404 n=1 Tax=Neovison vison TaxID=452646 RepID=UPI001CF035CF|nr:uncharacterized protein LOC122894404 [Neogale vison]
MVPGGGWAGEPLINILTSGLLPTPLPSHPSPVPNPNNSQPALVLKAAVALVRTGGSPHHTAHPLGSLALPWPRTRQLFFQLQALKRETCLKPNSLLTRQLGAGTRPSRSPGARSGRDQGPRTMARWRTSNSQLAQSVLGPLPPPTPALSCHAPAFSLWASRFALESPRFLSSDPTRRPSAGKRLAEKRNLLLPEANEEFGFWRWRIV